MKLVLKPIISVLSRIAGFATVLLILVNMFDSKFGFLSVETATTLVTAQNWLILICVALLGLDFSLRVPFFFFAYLILVAIIVILACIPGFELPLVGSLIPAKQAGIAVLAGAI